VTLFSARAAAIIAYVLCASEPPSRAFAGVPPEGTPPLVSSRSDRRRSSTRRADLRRTGSTDSHRHRAALKGSVVSEPPAVLTGVALVAVPALALQGLRGAVSISIHHHGPRRVRGRPTDHGLMRGPKAGRFRQSSSPSSTSSLIDGLATGRRCGGDLANSLSSSERGGARQSCSNGLLAGPRRAWLLHPRVGRSHRASAVEATVYARRLTTVMTWPPSAVVAVAERETGPRYDMSGPLGHRAIARGWPGR